jgi:hypothetical protein
METVYLREEHCSSESDRCFLAEAPVTLGE